MDDEYFSEEEELEMLVQLAATKRAQDIVSREGAALAQSARQQNTDAISADTQLLTIAITQAIIDALSGNLEGAEAEEPRTPKP